MKKAKMYNRLTHMKHCCYNTNYRNYPTNGGRGIIVDERWLDPEYGLDNFIEDVGYPPSEDAQLTRRNKDGNFTKDNVYWLQNTPERIREQKRLYKMRSRCYNPNDSMYQYYGGKGVTICDRWLDPEYGLDNFMSDMGPCPGDDYSIDRIDNDGPYSPENCRWATEEEQTDNRSKGNIQYYDIDGKQLSSREICDIVGDGCTPVVIAKRYERGSIGKDLLKPMSTVAKYPTPRGLMTVGEIVKMSGVHKTTLISRLKSNPNITWTELTKPPKLYGGRVAKTYDTLLGPLTGVQIAKIGGINTDTVPRRLDKGITGTELFITHHQHDPVYIKYYGYMNNSEYMIATRYNYNGTSIKQRKELSATQGWLTLNPTATHILSDGTTITTKDLLARTQLKNEILTWFVVRYEIPVEVLWNRGPIEKHQWDVVIAKYTPGNLVALVANLKFLPLLHVQLLRRGIDLYALPSREQDVSTMMDRIGISTKRYTLICIPTTGTGEVIVTTPDLTVLEIPPDHIVGAVEMVHGGNVRVHIPETDTTEHQFIMSPTSGVGLVKQPDGTFDIKEYP